MIPIHIAANVIRQYIYLATGSMIEIRLPIQQHEEEKFITALNIAMLKLNVSFHESTEFL